MLEIVWGEFVCYFRVNFVSEVKIILFKITQNMMKYYYFVLYIIWSENSINLK